MPVHTVLNSVSIEFVQLLRCRRATVRVAGVHSMDH